MVWFKIDDGFYDHPKVVGLDVAAVGLWALAGAYCARHLTDGTITDKQVRQIGGTRRQAEKLVAAGLWRSEGASPSARRYVFNDWREFQPTRDDVEEKRAIDRQRKAEARARKANKQAERENVQADTSRTSDGTTHRTNFGIQEMSALPDPTRPDPTKREGEVVSHVPVGARDDFSPSLDDLAAAHSAGAASPTPPVSPPATPGPGGLFGTPDDPRCAEHAHLRREDVPPCRMCAAAREQHQARAADEANRRRVEIEACGWCDDRGMVEIHTPDGSALAARCDHTSPPEPPPTATQGEFQPTSDPGVRKRLLNRSKGPTPPF